MRIKKYDIIRKREKLGKSEGEGEKKRRRNFFLSREFAVYKDYKLYSKIVISR